MNCIAIAAFKPKDILRFWQKVYIRRLDECWPWLASTLGGGYGGFSHQDKMLGAHRVAYHLAHGPIPPGLCVLHHCDNPPCCNPAHLKVGTQADNIRDRDNRGRGRQASGERNGNAIHSDAFVAQVIRDYSASGRSIAATARKYGISSRTALCWIRGRSRSSGSRAIAGGALRG